MILINSLNIFKEVASVWPHILASPRRRNRFGAVHGSFAARCSTPSGMRPPSVMLRASWSDRATHPSNGPNSLTTWVSDLAAKPGKTVSLTRSASPPSTAHSTAPVISISVASAASASDRIVLGPINDAALVDSKTGVRARSRNLLITPNPTFPEPTKSCATRVSRNSLTRAPRLIARPQRSTSTW